ncbi:MAG: molybdopterin cofactor-binding domain-containing protein [Burkholderiaceae bacterium]
MKAPAPLTQAPRVRDWIRLQPEGRVQVLTGRVELGQGNLTALLQIAADELDVPIALVDISSGDTRLTPNEGFTSSSLSIAQGGMSIRWAASAARHLVLARAAAMLDCPSTVLSLHDGEILRDGKTTSLSLWSLADAISEDDLVEAHAAPKPAAERHITGRSVARIDLRDRLMGAPFVHDLMLPDMLHGRVVHPPCLGASLNAFDEQALRERPGVEAVLRDGSVIGVVARSTHHANLACDWAHANVRWNVPAADIPDAVAAIAASQEDTTPIHEAGDVSQVSGERIHHKVSRPYLSHGSIGPSAAVALWQDKRLQLWSHAQGPYPLRDAIAMVLKIPATDIDVIHLPGAGCYGHNGADDVALDAALLARTVPGRPVKVVWSRADEFRCSPLGPGMVTRIDAVVDTDHRLLAMDVMVNSAPHGNRPGRNGSPNLRAAAFLAEPMLPSRSNDIPPENGGGADRNASPLYVMDHVRVQKRIVHDLPYRTSSLRGLGAYMNVYAIETLMDRLAAQAGEDPFDYRLRHLQDERAIEVLQTLRREIERWQALPHSEGVGCGIGFARYKNTAAYCAIWVRALVQERVRITHAIAVLDGGEIINPDGVINQTEGGMLQSLSWTTQEAIRFDGPAVASENWLDYPILTFSDVPAIDVVLINRPDQPPLGCAEGAQGPMAAAIGNAVHDAIGVHVPDLPITHDALVKAALNH